MAQAVRVEDDVVTGVFIVPDEIADTDALQAFAPVTRLSGVWVLTKYDEGDPDTVSIGDTYTGLRDGLGTFDREAPVCFTFGNSDGSDPDPSYP